MTKEIIVNVSPRETRTAVLEDGNLMELRVEREERVVGSIYKGIVQNVLPGMDAAFVDVGLERNAFLYVADILPDEELDGESPASIKRSDLRRRQIKDLLRPSEEILVQVIKGAHSTKGARVSSRISLPGRYLVLVPNGNHVGVSRKIEHREERDRLKRIGDKIRPEGFGLVLRTECEGRTERELRADVKYLVASWQRIDDAANTMKAPACIYRDQTLLYRTVRNMLSDDINRMVIDDPDEYEKVHAIATMISPQLKNKIQLYDSEVPIFDTYNVERDLDKLLRRKVWLKSGAYLVMDEMEAITAIDINTGKNVGSTNLSDTILKANLEAAEEVGRQLRLRDIGGIIVVDFIDMTSAGDRKQVLNHFSNILKRDRARTRVGRISSLGLVELTRKRTEESITEAMTSQCPHCEGLGRVPSSETVSLWVERDLKRALSEPGNALYVECHPDVCEAIIGTDGANVENLEHMLRRSIYVRANNELTHEQYSIESGTMEEIEQDVMGYRRAQVLECNVRQSSLGGPTKAIGWTDTGFYIELIGGEEHIGRRVKICLEDIRRSFAVGSVILQGAKRNGHSD